MAIKKTEKQSRRKAITKDTKKENGGMVTIETDRLIAAAKDINEKIKLATPIPEHGDPQDIQDAIVAEGIATDEDCGFFTEDGLSEETVSVLEELDVELKTSADDDAEKKVEPKPKKTKAASKPENGKTGEAKTAEPEKKTGKSEKPKKVKKEKKEATVRLTRADSIFQAVRQLGIRKAGVTAEQLEEKSSALLTAATGRQAGRADQECRLVLSVLVEFGLGEKMSNGAVRLIV